MENNSIKDIVNEVVAGRERTGSRINPEITKRLQEITHKLSLIDNDDIQFLLFLSNKQLKDVKELESHADKLILEYCLLALNMNKPNWRLAAYEGLNAKGFF